MEVLNITLGKDGAKNTYVAGKYLFTTKLCLFNSEFDWSFKKHVGIHKTEKRIQGCWVSPESRMLKRTCTKSKKRFSRVFLETKVKTASKKGNNLNLNY